MSCKESFIEEHLCREITDVKVIHQVKKRNKARAYEVKKKEMSKIEAFTQGQECVTQVLLC